MKHKRFFGWLNRYWGDAAWAALLLLAVVTGWYMAPTDGWNGYYVEGDVAWLILIPVAACAAYTAIALCRIARWEKRGLRDWQYLIAGLLLCGVLFMMTFTPRLYPIFMMEDLNAVTDLVNILYYSRFAIWAYKCWQARQAKKLAVISAPGEGVVQFLVENNEGDK